MIDDFAVKPMDHGAHHLAATQSSDSLERLGGAITGATSLLAGDHAAAAGLTVAQHDQAADRLPSLANLQLRPISWQSPSRIGLGLLHIFEGGPSPDSTRSWRV